MYVFVLEKTCKKFASLTYTLLLNIIFSYVLLYLCRCCLRRQVSFEDDTRMHADNSEKDGDDRFKTSASVIGASFQMVGYKITCK